MLNLLSAAPLLAAGPSMEIPTPDPLPLPHFPSRLHAFIWRNWQLVPVERMAEVAGATSGDIREMGMRMGLREPLSITENQRSRSYVTVIRRNWHLLPCEQLETLLGWDRERLEYTLREDDFLFIKLGVLKPRCDALRYDPPTPETLQRERKVAEWVARDFPEGVGGVDEPLFRFVDDLSAPAPELIRQNAAGLSSPRFCYSYFAPYGDALLDPALDPYPDGLLARLASVGVNGVWLQAVLYTLAPFPWAPRVSARWQERLANLHRLVERAARHGIGVYLYMNEPRAMPSAFFDKYPELRGAVDVREKTHASLCTSVPEVRAFMRGAVRRTAAEVPGLAGLFSITFSENWTHCWAHSHETGQPASGCARCAQRPPEEVIAEVNATLLEGVREAGANMEVIVWDWVWPDAWIPGIIERLPEGVSVMSVSEWDKPICVGGTPWVCGEYSLSVVGPAPRSLRTWELARARDLRTVAKVQASNSWEMSSVPYIPAVENVAKHAANLRDAGVDGLMESWTLGGYPSPGLELFNEMGRDSSATADAAMRRVAERWFGPELAPRVVEAWRAFSRAFSEYPFDRTLLYSAPVQTGPSNLLWEENTGYQATMVGYPYDDLESWCAIFSPENFIAQFEKVADGFDAAIADLRTDVENLQASARWERALERELGVAEACAIHCRSCANQAAFILARRELADTTEPAARQEAVARAHRALESEIALARRLYKLQARDSRLGFEASNQYMYVPVDLAEKVLNCRDLLERWLPDRA